METQRMLFNDCKNVRDFKNSAFYTTLNELINNSCAIRYFNHIRDEYPTLEEIGLYSDEDFWGEEDNGILYIGEDADYCFDVDELIVLDLLNNILILRQNKQTEYVQFIPNPPKIDLTTYEGI